MGLALDEPSEHDKVETINDVVVAIEEAILPNTETISLDIQNGGLVIVGIEGCC